MAVLPCTQCPKCGLWNQFTVKKCECGANLSGCRLKMIDVNKLSVMEYGDIQENLAYYGQICPKCGAISFTADTRKRHRVCGSCKDGAIAAVHPVYYLDLPLKQGGKV